mmetsp:Transcript_23734/g.60699  ORF Transcript_23734/g.60699 Transcript_23734/m.60699 type:complete len:124 (-) Transcript_23734:1573-1944(-)
MTFMNRARHSCARPPSPSACTSFLKLSGTPGPLPPVGRPEETCFAIAGGCGRGAAGLGDVDLEVTGELSAEEVGVPRGEPRTDCAGENCRPIRAASEAGEPPADSEKASGRRRRAPLSCSARW